METTELLKKVRQIEIKTRGFRAIFLPENTTVLLKDGEWHSRKFVNTSLATISETSTGMLRPVTIIHT